MRGETFWIRNIAYSSGFADLEIAGNRFPFSNRVFISSFLQELEYSEHHLLNIQDFQIRAVEFFPGKYPDLDFEPFVPVEGGIFQYCQSSYHLPQHSHMEYLKHTSKTYPQVFSNKQH